MTAYRFVRWLGVCIVWVSLAACSSLPAELSVDNESTVITHYQGLVQSHSGQTVRLGGVIASVTNYPHRTRLVLVNIPIGKDGKPLLKYEPKGRYLVDVEGFLDPMTFSKGRLITVLGTAQPAEKNRVGDYQLRIPVIQASAYHLWRLEERVILDEPMHFFMRCRHFMCSDDMFDAKSGRVIREVK
jgi:outer membrane lipoprotein